MAIRSPVGRGILLKLGGFLRWWGNELLNLLPKRARAFILPPQTKLLIEIHKMGTLRLSKLTPEGREPLMTVRPRNDPARPEDDNSLHSLARDVDSVVISLPESCGVRRQVELPAAARENLREVLAMEMDRLTPFKAQDIYFAYSEPRGGRTKEQINIDLSIVPKTVADDVLRMARSLGIEPNVLALGSDDDLARNLLASEGNAPRAVTRRVFAPLYGLTVAVLAAAAIAVPFLKQAGTIQALQSQISTVQSKHGDFASLEQQLAEWHEGAARITEMRRKNPPAVAVLNELSHTLPKGTWLTQLDLSSSPSRLEISGYSDRPTDLIAPLEASATLSGVKFDEPVAFDERASRDRFRLSANVDPVTAGARP